ncbi:Terminal organelle assembly protein [Trema orientale]|uniref:Terminal organelle assembly protein n=1 Tax=Trema orientale TaxID=63057 RepID=A0A2P5FD91_TREOI|nr:Terminal organelle assembly protein [Trema orientale]
MERNREAALSAKEIAEKKFKEQDIVGAKTFAIKAQSLSPELDGLPQLIATLDVYISAERRPNQEVDWYRVLSVDPQADAATIKTHYKKLALAIHPDRNKSVGADGAFKILSEAWSLLSDKDGRILYDQKQNLRFISENLSDRKSSVSCGQNGFHNPSNRNGSHEQDYKGATYSRAFPASSCPTKPTFWTVCSACKTFFEYLRRYLNHNLVCSNCCQPFYAFEMPPPPINGNGLSHPWSSYIQQRNSSQCTINKNSCAQERRPASMTKVGLAGFFSDSSKKTFQAGLYSGVGGAESMRPMAYVSAQAAFGIHSGFGKLRRKFEDIPLNPLREECIKPSSHVLKNAGAGLDNGSSGAERRPASITKVGLAGFSSDSSKKTFQAGLYSRVGGAESMRPMAYVSAQAASGIHSGFGKLRRKFEDIPLNPLREECIKPGSHVLKNAGAGLDNGSSDAGFSTMYKGDRHRKRRQMEDQKIANSVRTGNGVGAVETIYGSEKVSVGKKRMNIAANCKIKCTRELSLLESRNMLMEKAKKAISKKLNARRLADASKVQYKLKEVRVNGNGKKEAVKPVVKADMSKGREHVASKEKKHTAITPPVKSDVNTNASYPDPVSISVSDPDFYDFDKNRTESSFGSDQLWAAYDEDDGMPRYYAMVHCVISLKPFKMRISWLNSKSNNELAPLNWVASAFFKTSGDFRTGKPEVYTSLNSFSHQVKWTKGSRRAIQIYPTKGDVWALYKNWSPDWNKLTPEEVIHKYDMVEVLENYNEERGVTIMPLVKVAGFKTLFRQHWDPSKIRTIPREQMFRFSHQVPSYLLTGNEGQNAPKDCLELDPAATPLELLEVTTEVQKKETVETAEKTKRGDLVESLERPKAEELVENWKAPIGKGLIQDSKREVAAEVIRRERETKEGKWVVYKRRRPTKVTRSMAKLKIAKPRKMAGNC